MSKTSSNQKSKEKIIYDKPSEGLLPQSRDLEIHSCDLNNKIVDSYIDQSIKKQNTKDLITKTIIFGTCMVAFLKLSSPLIISDLIRLEIIQQASDEILNKLYGIAGIVVIYYFGSKIKS